MCGDAGPEAAHALRFLHSLTKMLWFQLTCCIVPSASDLALLAQCAHIERLQVCAEPILLAYCQRGVHAKELVLVQSSESGEELQGIRSQTAVTTASVFALKCLRLR